MGSELLALTYTRAVDFLKMIVKHDTIKGRRRIIRCDKFRFWYCMYIKDRKSLWSAFESDEYKFIYCRSISRRPLVYKTIKSEVIRRWEHWENGPGPKLRKDFPGPAAEYNPHWNAPEPVSQYNSFDRLFPMEEAFSNERQAYQWSCAHSKGRVT